MIKHNWKMYAVRLDKKAGGHFLASGNGAPVALFFDRADAVNHARDCITNGFHGAVPVRVNAAIEQTHRPSRKGMVAWRAADAPAKG